MDLHIILSKTWDQHNWIGSAIPRIALGCNFFSQSGKQRFDEVLAKFSELYMLYTLSKSNVNP